MSTSRTSRTPTSAPWPRPRPTRPWRWRAVRPVSVREIADTVCDLVAPVPVEHVPGPGGRLRRGRHLRQPGQGAAGLGAGHAVRGRGPPVPGLARRDGRPLVMTAGQPDQPGPRGQHSAPEGRPAASGLRSAATREDAASRGAAPARRQHSALLVSGSIGMGHDALAAACARRAGAARLPHGHAGRDAAARPAGQLGGRGACSGPCWRCPACSTPSTSPRCAPAAGWPCWPTPRPAARSCPGCATTSTSTRPTWLSRCSPPRASALSRLARRYPAMSHVVFCTDVTPHRLWVHPNVDLYLVTSGGRRGGRAPVRPGRPGAGAAAAGPARLLHRPRRRTRPAISWASRVQERCVLLMSGAWGLGPVASAAEALGHAGVHVLAVAGRNARLERRADRGGGPPAAGPGHRLHRSRSRS